MFVDKDYGLVNSKAELNMMRRLNNEIARRKHRSSGCQIITNLSKLSPDKCVRCDGKHNEKQ
jgi:hypothetical protein